jgi:hypothetical protein
LILAVGGEALTFEERCSGAYLEVVVWQGVGEIGTETKRSVESRSGAGRTRFHLPLVEPDGRFSRIRLSDKDDA